MKIIFRIATLFIACAILLPSHAMDNVSDGLPDHIAGDVGLAVYTSNLHIGTEGMQSFVLPYAFADYKRAFIRIDQIGLKTLKIGYGYLEVVGKINLDNHKAKSPFNGNSINRSDPIPLGIGTFQETPIGGFFLTLIKI